MKYPKLRVQEASRQMVDTFKGYNHNLRIGDGEFFDMKDAYDKGIITEEYVAAVYNCTPAEYYNIYT